MAGAPAGSRWAETVAAIDAVVGAVLLIAGLYLTNPSVLDLGLYLEADRYLLAGIVLAYAGLVFTYAGLLGLAPPSSGFVSQLAGGLFGTAARLCVLALMLTFAVRAWLAGLAPEWVLLPAGAGLLAFANLPFAAIARARAAGPGADRSITADSGKSTPFDALRYAGMAVTVTVTIILSLFVFGAALIAYILLDRAFIEGRPISLTIAAEVVSGSLVWIVVMFAQIVIGLFAIAGIAGWVGERRRRREANGFERDLSADEISFANACVAQIRAYAAEQRLTSRRSPSLWLALGLCLAALLLFGTDGGWVADFHAPASDAWQFYVVAGAGPTIAGLLLLFSLAFVPNAILKLVSRRAAEASGAVMLKVNQGAGALEAEIVKRVRDRSLAPDTPFDAGELMRTWGVTTGVIAIGWSILVFGGVAVWWPHDRARDTVFSEDGIATGDFWTMERVVHRYEAVEGVFVTCDESGDVGYEIVLPGNALRSLLTQGSLRARLDNLAKVDGKLRAAGVAFLFALPDEALTSNLPVVDRMCVLDLLEDFDAADHAKVEQIFHLDEWYERRWRMRTGQPPRVAAR